ncbi:MAG: carboxypeptidase-like regulatory domain-containing protein [Candidatus Acidiferrum sp.]
MLSVVFGQGETTGAIVGQMTDATKAAISGATVTIENRETSLQRTAKTDDEGRFNFPQLKPGTYSIKVEAEGFDPRENDNVLSGLGQKQTVNFTLKVCQSNQTVEVSGAAPLINPENPNTTTNLNAPALENLPNPGGDLTYPLQFAAGALINTAGSGNDFVGGMNGYGNMEFGLPALSNGYIVDGLETNDPLTNLNSGLSTNLVLGLNSISEVTVNTLSYAVDRDGTERRRQSTSQNRVQTSFTEISTSFGTVPGSMQPTISRKETIEQWYRRYVDISSREVFC